MLHHPILLLACIALLLISDMSIAQESESQLDSTAEIQLSDETLQLRYIDTGDHFGIEKSRLTGAFFLSEARDVVLSAGLQLPANIDLGPVTFTFGPQLYAALLDEENSDIMAMSIGTELRLDLAPSLGLAVTGQAYYAPDILTFGSADNIVDLSARLEVGLADRLILFGGIRLFEFDLTEGEGERTLQDEVFAGFGYRF
jgi:YfaZ precursor